MKPGDHPEFFRFPAPLGASRESTIELDAQGRFWHDGERVEHAAMNQAFAGWIRRHPDDGRFILSNDYDWTYFKVADVPFFVLSVAEAGDQLKLSLSDGSAEYLDPSSLRTGMHHALYCKVKGATFEARFMPHSQNQLAPWLVEDCDGGYALQLGSRRFSIAAGSV